MVWSSKTPRVSAPARCNGIIRMWCLDTKKTMVSAPLSARTMSCAQTRARAKPIASKNNGVITKTTKTTKTTVSPTRYVWTGWCLDRKRTEGRGGGGVISYILSRISQRRCFPFCWVEGRGIREGIMRLWVYLNAVQCQSCLNIYGVGLDASAREPHEPQADAQLVLLSREALWIISGKQQRAQCPVINKWCQTRQADRGM